MLRRNLGLEAVLRIRCTNGLALNTFHGNFFVRSTDLLALPNINPNAGFAFQLEVRGCCCACVIELSCLD